MREITIDGRRIADDEKAYLIDKPVIDENGCWLWAGTTDRQGYGRVCMSRKGKKTYATAHVFAWERATGKKRRPGYQIDHLCNVPSCINPDHLEEVTQHENWRRSRIQSRLNQLKTHCKYGHEFTPENIYRAPSNKPHHRRCRICMNAYRSPSRCAKSQ